VIRYLLRRIGNMVLMLLGASVLLFVLSKAAPGDFVTAAAADSKISAQTIAAMRAQYGLDRPLPVRYWKWLRSVARGDLGYSFAYNVPVSSLLAPRARNTLLLAVPSLLLSWLIAIPVGVYAASRRRGWMDRMFSVGTSTLLALPDLLIALLVMLFALHTGIFPVGGMGASSGAEEMGRWAAFKDLVWHMVLPVTALVLASLPTILRHVRASVVQVLESSYMKAAEANGLPGWKLLYSYALPAAANPLISLFGLTVAGLLSMSLLVEVVLSWPGLGPLVLEAIQGRDLFVVIGSVMFSMLFMVFGNLLADFLLYGLDPRIRMQP
jgi:peptide/nickel transport system permease protein